MRIYTKTAEGGDSMSSLIAKGRATSYEVGTRQLQSVIDEFGLGANKIFVKMDIEGGEYELLPSIVELLSDERISFFIEFHHKMFRLSHNDGSEDWRERYENSFEKTCMAMPLGRRFTTEHDEALTDREVLSLLRGGLTKNNEQARDLVIS